MAQASPLEFSPPQSNTPSPSPTSALATSKHARFSPAPTLTSPYGSLSNLQTPPLLNDYTQSTRPYDQVNGDSETTSKQPGAMGPPSKPPAINTANLTDVVAASGIDMVEEENLLLQSFNPNSSFHSARSGLSATQSLSAGNSFNDISQLGTAANGSYFAQSGRLGGAADVSSVQEIALEAERQKAKAHGEKMQFHLNNPYLSGFQLRHRLSKISSHYELSTPENEYLFTDYEASRKVKTKAVQGTDGSAIVQSKVELVIPKESHLGDMIAILSVAANERLRGLTETAFTISKGRESHSFGEIPSDWQDIAVNANDELRNGLATDAENNGASASKKRRLDTSETQPNPVATTLQTGQSNDISAEDARQAKRARRVNPNASGGASTPSASTGTLGDVAPEVEPKKLTKKEQAKAASARHDESFQAKSANATLSHVFGGRQKYSWMTAANSSAGPSGASKPTTGRNAPGASKSGAGTAGGSSRALKRFGDWREDGPAIGARGLQLRDIIAALELDGRAIKTLATAQGKMNF